jgi:uncharacterized repeat protein (TIGR01451 family)
MLRQRVVIATAIGAVVLSGAGAAVVAATTGGGADLQIQKISLQDLASPGGVLRYLITVTNRGPDDATDVALDEQQPEGIFGDVAPTPTTTQGTCTAHPSSPPSLNCNLGTIPAKGKAIVAVDASIIGRPPVPGSDRGYVRSIATISSPDDPAAHNRKSELKVRIEEPSALSASEIQLLLDAANACVGVVANLPFRDALMGVVQERASGQVPVDLSILGSALYDFLLLGERNAIQKDLIGKFISVPKCVLFVRRLWSATSPAEQQQPPPAQPPPSPAESSSSSRAPASPRTEPPQVPATFVGTWTGIVTQDNYDKSPYPYNGRITAGRIGDIVGTGELPSLGCMVNWTLRRAAKTEIVVHETVSRGAECVDTDITLTLLSDGTLRYIFDGGAGRATLRRTS